MSLQEIITESEKNLQNLNDQYHQTQYSQAECERRCERARSFHQVYDTIMCNDSYTLVLVLLEKMNDGFAFDGQRDHVYTDSTGATLLSLNRPAAVLEQEFKDLRINTEAAYALEIESKKSELLQDIARMKLSIRDGQRAIEVQQKKDADSAQMLAQVQEELNPKPTAILGRKTAKASKEVLSDAA